MFRARKPSVKRQKLDDPSPRKRAKLINPVKELLRKDVASIGKGSVKASVSKSIASESLTTPHSLPEALTNVSTKVGKYADTKNSATPDVQNVDNSCATNPDGPLLNCEADPQVPLSPSLKEKDTDNTNDEAKIDYDVAKKLAEISPCTVKRTTEDDEEQNEQVVVEEAEPVISVDTSSGKTKVIGSESGLELKNETLQDPLSCGNEEVNDEERIETQENDERQLWPPYADVEDEDFVSVRTERIISVDNDPIIESALSLLP